TINNKKIKDEASVVVIEENGIRYVNLKVMLVVQGGRFNNYFVNYLTDLAKLSYSFNESEKDLKSCVFKDNLNEHATMITITGYPEVKQFKVINDGFGFYLNKKTLGHLKSASKDYAVYASIHSKLLIPKEITTDEVSIKINGKWESTYNGGYWATINNKKIKDEASVVVIEENGIRYVDLKIMFIVQSGRFSNYFVGYLADLADLNYLVTDSEEGEKYYTLQQQKLSPEKNLKIILKVKNGKDIIETKKFKISSNHSGIFLSKKSLKFIKSRSADKSISGELYAKLLIPKEITADKVSIKVNGKWNSSYNGGYWATINNNKIKDEASVVVVEENGVRYVNLKIAFEIQSGRFSSYFVSNLADLANLGYVVSDGEKTYPLKPMKE
ncbi:hypothetical protein JHD47_06625, partial [Sulfurimonas sp. SAG-AH-194-L11]